MARMIKKITISFFFASFLSFTLPAAAADFPAFLKSFQDAVAKGDTTKVVSLTQFPFFYQEQIDAKAFEKAYPKIFTPKVKACFAKAKPVKDQQNYDVFCGEQIFQFGPVKGEYKFLEIGVND